MLIHGRLGACSVGYGWLNVAERRQMDEYLQKWLERLERKVDNNTRITNVLKADVKNVKEDVSEIKESSKSAASSPSLGKSLSSAGILLFIIGALVMIVAKLLGVDLSILQ